MFSPIILHRRLCCFLPMFSNSPIVCLPIVFRYCCCLLCFALWFFWPCLDILGHVCLGSFGLSNLGMRLGSLGLFGQAWFRYFGAAAVF